MVPGIKIIYKCSQICTGRIMSDVECWTTNIEFRNCLALTLENKECRCYELWVPQSQVMPNQTSQAYVNKECLSYQGKV